MVAVVILMVLVDRAVVVDRVVVVVAGAVVVVDGSAVVACAGVGKPPRIAGWNLRVWVEDYLFCTRTYI